MKTLQTDVCIIGGGPAGMFIGLLLAKQVGLLDYLESQGNHVRITDHYYFW